jgi:hypothetical protein
MVTTPVEFKTTLKVTETLAKQHTMTPCHTSKTARIKVHSYHPASIVSYT